MEFKLGEDYALQMDAEDPLAGYKDRFYQIPGKIYMDARAYRHSPILRINNL